MKFFLFAAGILGCAVPLSADVTYSTVANAGSTAWLQAAATGRADMLVVGDSVGQYWDYGFNAAVASHVGLAGTGLTVDDAYNSMGNGYSITAVDNGSTSIWNHNASAAPASANAYQWTQSGAQTGLGAVTAASPSATLTATFQAGGPLNPMAAYDWTVYSASGTTGSITASRSISSLPAAVQTLAPVTTSTPATGLQKNVFSFNAITGFPTQTTGASLQVSNSSIYYSRLINPTAKGATVSAWFQPGASMYNYVDSAYYAGPTNAAGREAVLNALTDGGSGKLMIVISEGFNDIHAIGASLNGVTPANSAAAFIDNVKQYIADVRIDWTLAGKSLSNLSFLTLGEYQDGFLDDTASNQLLRDYADQLHQLALSDSQVSFVDVDGIAPDYNTANSLGYMTDQIHMTNLGATVYANGVMNALAVPEPTAIAGIATFGLLAARRRRSTGR